MGQLKASEKIVTHQEEGNIVVVNTCGFIDNAKEESVNKILEQIQKKKSGIIDPTPKIPAILNDPVKT